MNQEIIKILSSSKTDPSYVSAVLDYIRTGAEADLPSAPFPRRGYDLNQIWTLLAKEPVWLEGEARLAMLAIDSAVRFKSNSESDWALELLLRDLGSYGGEGRIQKEHILADLAKSRGLGATALGKIVDEEYGSTRDWGLGDEVGSRSEPSFSSPLEQMVFEADDQTLASFLWQAGRASRYAELITLFKPHVIDIWWSGRPKRDIHKALRSWEKIVRITDRFDSECLGFIGQHPWITERFSLLEIIHKTRGGYEEELTAIARMPECLKSHSALEWLLDRVPDEVIALMGNALTKKTFKKYGANFFNHEAYQRFFGLVMSRWDGEGRAFFECMNIGECEGLELHLLSKVLESIPPSAQRASAILVLVEGKSADETASRWDAIELSLKGAPPTDPEAGIYRDAFWRLLGNTSSKLRSHGAKLLVALGDDGLVEQAAAYLSGGNANQKLGAIELLELTKDARATGILASALANEESKKIRSAIHSALKSAGIAPIIEQVAIEGAPAANLDAYVASQSKGLKFPKCSWLDISALPALIGTDGNALSIPFINILIAKQSNHKTLEAAPDVLPVMAYIDRERNATFAAALVEGFLKSEQAAADRWALTFGGLLGDKRIINLLLPRIQGWCENARCKLAEYAAQAISLLPGNEPLMVLDSLSNRYRSKFKNVGRACSEAFSAAATARGITADELADMVVPDFGFDAEGVRRFDWDGGGISAELGADFKLSWFDTETEKSWKSLPTNAPEEVKAEVKSVTKLIRETVKAQTARLEMSLVRQRRWPVARWRELFENHPLLRSFASGLVWGVYDGQGQLLRTFRRYGNGILADASGGMEELPETDTLIGMIHPLELTTESLASWHGHFARMKVKQPFPQLERPVETMDPLHGNRRSINLTVGKSVSAGTFRSRAEKRGWVRGSVVDAGGISSYYKLYPGAGIEVVLPTNNFWIGCDPMEEIELEAAYFATAGTVERGSYIYDEPAPDDPRVLRFDQVAPVVFSETIGDLKAITDQPKK